jgi:hypothetical protein
MTDIALLLGNKHSSLQDGQALGGSKAAMTEDTTLYLAQSANPVFASN